MYPRKVPFKDRRALRRAGKENPMRQWISTRVALGTALLAGLLLQGVALAQTRELATRGVLLDRVAAVVNDGVVLNSELEDQVAAVSERLRGQKLELPPENVLRQQV